MKTDDVRMILEAISEGTISIEEALGRLSTSTYVDMDQAKLDTGRDARTGGPEAILCEGKTIEQVIRIVSTMRMHDVPIIATRASPDVYDGVRHDHPDARYNELGRVITIGEPAAARGSSPIVILTAGTSDLPVAEEAAETARMLGDDVALIGDVGVAGIHRLIGHLDTIRSAGAVIVAAGMDGALASVVGGLVNVPVIAVPTSVGYGASFEGLSALLAMLNSCAPGISVVNIDNGFGAAYVAHRIVRVRGR
ncbi:MAG TPA: nickel pincer cofactor biosynthesis protein LarB [Methanomicrobia archaeon]|nr:nickel pincer cofactor biosynthesis protein LarB [Methanomicrobia archaeon]